MKNILALIIVVVFIVSLSFFARTFYAEKTEEKNNTTVEFSTIETDDELTGEELARMHCIECHDFTEPELLTKKSWNFLLTYMGLRLGIDDDSYHPNPTKVETEVIESRRLLLTAEKLIPEEPAMSDEDWKKLREYYQDNAPEKAIPPKDKPTSTGKATLFAEKKHRYKLPYSVTSMIHIDESQQQILVGDSAGQKITILDRDLFLIDSISSKNNFWVDAIPLEKEIYLLTVGDIPGSFPGERLGRVAYGKRMGDMFFPEGNVLEELYRPTDMEFADLNNDGEDELVICSFGDEGGDFSIFRRSADGRNFEQEPITTLYNDTGSITCAIHDFNSDGLQDLVLMVSDVLEHVSLFINKGNFEFSERIIVQTHPSWGYMGLQLADMNGDGQMDIITSNGDNGDSDPYNTLKSYHGIRIYLNDQMKFKESFFYSMYGCYQVVAYDFDLDGDIDLAANAFHPNFYEEEPENFVFLEQTEPMEFSPKHHTATQKGRWMTMGAGDLDQDGDVDIALGGAYVPIGLPEEGSEIYKKYMQGDTLLFLENKTIK